jgi:uncharacterized membrane protein SpoIIM required for sporulation
LVAGHGILELSCIIVASAAGMKMGWAVVSPGTATRGAALRRQARDSVKIVLGTAPWLVVAGLIEGLVTPIGLSLPEVLALGVGVASVYWLLVLLLGRIREEHAASPAGTP